MRDAVTSIHISLRGISWSTLVHVLRFVYPLVVDNSSEMPKIRKLKRSKKFKTNINRKRLRDKLRKLPDIGCKDIKDAWEDTKSTRHNLGEMGLAYDPNEALKIPSLKRELQRNKDNSDSEEENTPGTPAKVHVARTLEADANAPRVRQFRLPDQQVQFLTYLMDKYGDDYKTMTRDKKNYYQLTWRQIRAKINTFKGVPEQYAEYLLKKGEIVLDDPTPLEETRKRIAEEQVRKHCAPKPKKIKPAKTAGWLEESVDGIDFDAGDKLEDITIDKDTTEQAGNKLKLFSDDESDEEDKASKTKSTKVKKSTDSKKTEKKVETTAESKQTKGSINRDSKRAKAVEKLASSDSDSDEEFEGDEDAADFVDLNDLSEEQLSEDDELDNGEFVTDSDEESE